jgi:hypothetical protein
MLAWLSWTETNVAKGGRVVVTVTGGQPVSNVANTASAHARTKILPWDTFMGESFGKLLSAVRP